MDASTGEVFPSLREALDAGVDFDNLVEISGEPAAIAKVSAAVESSAKKDRRARNKRASASRRRNRN